LGAYSQCDLAFGAHEALCKRRAAAPDFETFPDMLKGHAISKVSEPERLELVIASGTAGALYAHPWAAFRYAYAAMLTGWRG
jgi:hypothetical protein